MRALWRARSGGIAMRMKVERGEAIGAAMGGREAGTAFFDGDVRGDPGNIGVFVGCERSAFGI